MVNSEAPATNYQTQTTIFIVGPTASGKSQLAIDVAKQLNGEIVCADSQTIRKDMNIGTAKPSSEDQELARHHMLDIIDPYESFSAAEFKRRAEQTINEIHSRGKLPIIVGGTGLYVDTLLFDFSFKDKSDPGLRKRLESLSIATLQGIIRDRGYVMPTNNQNPRHLIRTIESKGASATKKTQRLNALVVGLDPGRDELKLRIEQRVDAMLQDGFVDEVRQITDIYGDPPNNWDAIGYKIVYESRVLNAAVSDEKLRALLVIAHRQYAKRQRIWFKRNPEIQWFTELSEARAHIQNTL